jgi:two-component system alkaline phosphatase synthesis response regulator PhoP
MGAMSKNKVLVIDDDEDVLDLLQYNLNSRGYKVKCVSDSSIALHEALKMEPDLIVLDIMMPEINGLELCQQLRTHKALENTPLFFLTAKTDNYIVPVALNSGGDDLIFKTSGIRSLILKIASVLEDGLVIRKRTTRLKIGRWELNRDAVSISNGKTTVQLTADEFELFFLLAQNPTTTMDATTIKNYIWGADIFHVASPIGEFVERIEKKMKANWIIEVKRNCFRFNLKMVL